MSQVVIVANEQLARLIERSLGDQFAVSTAADLEEMRRVVRRAQVELIVLDENALLAACVANFRELSDVLHALDAVPLLLLVSRLDEAAQVAASRSSGRVCLEKPFSPRKLRHTSHQMLHQPKSTHAPFGFAFCADARAQFHMLLL